MDQTKLTEGVFELHWQQREYGRFTWQLYARQDNGQLGLVDTEDFGPFQSHYDLSRWLGLRIWRSMGLPFA